MKRKREAMVNLLAHRELNACKSQSALRRYAEDKAAHFELEEMVCKLPVSVRSTFLMCFSPNGSRVASTHGDHKIYVCQVSTGKLLKALEGHPRTPWCLAFHPTNNDLLASGCLGGEVRVWDLRGGGSEVWVCPEKSVITSLSFHPMGNFIALSTINRVHFWDWSRSEPFATTKTSSEREKVRLVRFSPRGDYLLTGIANIRDRYIVQNRRSSILSRLMTMYQRLGEMLPASSHNASLQRRIARRGGVRRFSREDLHALLRMRSLGNRQTALHNLHRQRGERDRWRESERRNTRIFNQNLQDEQRTDSWLPHWGATLSPEGETSSGNVTGHGSASSLPGSVDEPDYPSEFGNTPLSTTRADTSDLWSTFNRLRALCTRLESRMMRHSDLSQPSSSSLPQFSATQSFGAQLTSSHSAEESPGTTRNDGRNEVSLSLVSLLSRLQESLQSFSEATALSGMNAARRQIREVRLRIAEILERLENVSGYRERLQSLREQIYQAAERMARRDELDQSTGEGSGSQQWDLAYCLWLVDMSLGLTNQMQRILTADYRLSRFHLGRTERPTRSQTSRLEEERMGHTSSGMFSFSSESESESEDEDHEHPTPPPFTPPPLRAPPYNLPRFPTASLGPLNAVTHRIQYWKTSSAELIPQISDSQASLVVSTCKIHNDGSVDVSPCGTLLVALVPDAVGVTLTVFSLRDETLGQTLYTWGFGPNAVSVSFSPLSRYVVVGLASSRYNSPQREVVAQIFRLGGRPPQGQTGSIILEHVGNMSQPLVGANSSHQLLSLNCVRWLPNPGEGLVYGTNRGTLCICRPLCSMCYDCAGEHAATFQEEHYPRTRRDSLFQTLSQHVEETATRHALLGRRN